MHNVKMDKEESVTSYLTRVVQVKDELVVVGEVIIDPEFVRKSSKGFTKEWDVFFNYVVKKENIMDWNRPWGDFTQEEIKEGS